HPVGGRRQDADDRRRRDRPRRRRGGHRDRGTLTMMRIAVVGVGHLGRHHARILSALPGVELTAVVDIHRARAEEIAAAHGTKPLCDYRDVLGHVDAVTIAVPTALHAEIGCACLEAGVAALVEKPLARTLAEADALIAAAARKGLTLAVGQTER